MNPEKIPRSQTLSESRNEELYLRFVAEHYEREKKSRKRDRRMHLVVVASVWLKIGDVHVVHDILALFVSLVLELQQKGHRVTSCDIPPWSVHEIGSECTLCA